MDASTSGDLTQSARLATLILLVAACLLQPGCRPSGTPPKLPGQGADGRLGPCDFSDFRSHGAEHITNYLERPIVLPVLAGRVESEGGQGWPDLAVVTIEVRTARGDELVHFERLEVSGEVSLPEIPPGEYCFKLMAEGWQSVIGLVILDESAPAEAELAVELLLGL